MIYCWAVTIDNCLYVCQQKFGYEKEIKITLGVNDTDAQILTVDGVTTVLESVPQSQWCLKYQELTMLPYVSNPFRGYFFIHKMPIFQHKAYEIMFSGWPKYPKSQAWLNKFSGFSELCNAGTGSSAMRALTNEGAMAQQSPSSASSQSNTPTRATSPRSPQTPSIAVDAAQMHMPHLLADYTKPEFGSAGPFLALLANSKVVFPPHHPFMQFSSSFIPKAAEPPANAAEAQDHFSATQPPEQPQQLSPGKPSQQVPPTPKAAAPAPKAWQWWWWICWCWWWCWWCWRDEVRKNHADDEDIGSVYDKQIDANDYNVDDNDGWCCGCWQCWWWQWWFKSWLIAGKWWSRPLPWWCGC